ncbi:MAG: hypothetical protein ACEY3E_02705 [Candidatus Tisiphia sp.]|jgi:hypothetical protein|uniref:hypothetical protein n=1 Tax=unclassified Candidatus Tisiphia TaxID=2996318 RepID=UPI001E72A5AD|nr:MAG: hypothetical protein LF884_02220 [Rickettsia endosymbiont of Cimex lectularius]
MPIKECNERTKEEIYASIVFRIKVMYHNKITDSEAHEAARNLIDFCQEIIDYKMKKQRTEQSKVNKTIISTIT